MYIKKCKRCGKEANTIEELDNFTLNKQCTHNREHRCRDCANDMKNTLVKEHKIEAIIDKGGRCTECSMFYNGQNGAAFQFHHVNPENKVASISRLLGRSYKRLKEELDKCVLICANCHSILHGTKY